MVSLEGDENYVLPKNSALFKLSPYIGENGLLRMRSRIERAQFVHHSARHPIILPKCHRMSMLIVDWYHIKYKHVSHEVVVNEMFQKYHISGLHQVFRKVRKAYQFFNIRNACLQPPDMAALPVGRVSPFCHEFTHVGLDFFGPFVTSVGLGKVNFGGLQAEFITTETSWKFIPTASPHRDGSLGEDGSSNQTCYIPDINTSRYIERRKMTKFVFGSREHSE